MTALARPAGLSLTVSRRTVAAAAFIAFGLVDIVGFGLYAKHGDASFAFSPEFAKVTVPNLSLPAAATAYVCGGISIAAGLARLLVPLGALARRVSIGVVLFAFVVALLCWAEVGQPSTFSIINLLEGTLEASIPLILGALAGCLCERSGVINIAIEGQLLFGAFTGAVAASFFGALWLGLVLGSAAGALLGAMLAVFAIRYLVDQVVLGVVLNVFAAGLTGFLYDRALVPYQNSLNSPATFLPVKIPLLGDIPIIGPVLFDSTIFLYITYVLLVGVQVGLFSTRWGLRVRAVGEHPMAADTVGIRVLGTRYGAVIMGGLIAGIGGAYLTIGSNGNFTPNISSGLGYIALAALIFGRWTPFGALAAALLFGFTSELQSVLSTINVPIPSDILLMAPYVATIVAVAGLVGRVRAPAADGKPYIKA
ncbi:MAG TPA: ABC transporter permease [Streptosporangiaceae bacterium]|nr:ABC transporter permease [Streptosporangiaceae bacterium]